LTERKGVAQNFLPTSLVNRLIIRRSFLIKSLKGMSIMYANFAYDDVIDYLKNKERQ